MKALTRGVLLLTPVGVAAAGAARKIHSMGAAIDRNVRPELDARNAPPSDVDHCTLALSAGGELHYVDTAPGDTQRPLVVLCHGITGQWWLWSAQIRGLRESCRVVAWDMRGHGRSTAGRDGVTIDAAARDLAELLQALGAERAVVCGHSMGGMVLGRFLVDHAEIALARVGGACFLATSAKVSTGSIRSGGLARHSKLLSRVAHAAGDRKVHYEHDNSFVAAIMSLGFGPGVTRRMVDDQIDLQNSFSPKSNREASASIATHDVESRLIALAGRLRAIPTIVLSAAHDRLTPPVHGRAIAAALPHADYRELPDSGHNIMVEDPDATIAALRNLLTTSPSASRERGAAVGQARGL